MLYTIIGTDIEKVRSRSRGLVSALQEKRPDASFFRLHGENISNDKLVELLGSVGLFSNKYIVLIDNILTGQANGSGLSATGDIGGDAGGHNDTDADFSTAGKKTESADKSPKDLILNNLDRLKASEHVWIIVEDSLFGLSSGKELGVRDTKSLEEIKKKLEKFSDKIEEHDIKSKKIERNFEINSFAFTDAFFNKDLKRALEALKLLKDQEVPAEEIHGALWWQVKSLFQIKGGEDKKMSPFVVSKGKKVLNKWSDKELIKLSDKVVEIYHDAHLGKTSLDDELMRLVLGFC